MADALVIQILDQIVEDLNTDRPGEVPAAEVRRVAPGERLDESFIAVFLGDEDVDPQRGNHAWQDPLTVRRVPVAIQCVVPTDLIAELDRVTTPMLIWTTSVLGRSRLGGLCHHLRETGTQRRAVYQDFYVMAATQIFECKYQTLRDDITRRNQEA